jgi:hypothetical protein
MRKLVLILIALIALVTFIRALDINTSKPVNDIPIPEEVFDR